jgi:hypothetical protein
MKLRDRHVLIRSAWALNCLVLSVAMLPDLVFSAPMIQSESEHRQDEMQLIEQLEKLQQQLESADLPQRDTAEKEILKLGPLVLDYLEVNPNASSDTQARIARIRAELEKKEIVKSTQASKVNLTGTFSIEDACQAISKQTGNPISLHRVPDAILEQEMELDYGGVEFWTAIYDLMNKSGLAIDPYAGEPGALTLTVDRVRRSDLQADPIQAATRIPRCGVGLFDCSVTRIVATRDFAKPASSINQLTMLVRWEPRLQPISIDMPFENVIAVDDDGNELALTRTEGVFHGAASADSQELEIFVPLKLTDRKIKRIKSFEAELIAVLPGRQETFRFRNIGKLESGVEQRKGGAIVTFEGIIKNEDLYGVNLTLQFDESFNALESYRGWAYDNPMYLETDDGKRIEPVTIEGLRQSNQMVSIRYYFLEDPKDCNIVYKSVGAIVKHNVFVKINDIDFP